MISIEQNAGFHRRLLEAYQPKREPAQLHSMGDTHRLAAASHPISERPKTKVTPREKDQWLPLICTTLPPHSRQCSLSIVSGTRLWRTSTRASSRVPRREIGRAHV